MSTDLKLDSSHDIVVTSGDLELATESTEVAQSCKIRLLLWQGEWILDFTEGVNWIDDIFDVSTSYEQKNSIIKAAILGAEHVESIIEYEFSMDYVNKGAQIDFTATSEFGDVVVEVLT
jgi:hypothetical protein